MSVIILSNNFEDIDTYFHPLDFLLRDDFQYDLKIKEKNDLD